MPSRYPRLSFSDRSFLKLEYQGGPEHVAGLCVLEPGQLLSATGELDLVSIRRRLQNRLVRAPVLRRIVHSPPPLCGPALWVDDPRFSLDRHVRTAAVGPPGDEASLLKTAEDILSPLLDRSHPLWELWFLTGVEGGRLGMLLKIHHAIADGLGVLALIASLFDLEADASDPPPEVGWSPTAGPSARELLFDNLRVRATSAVSTLAHPIARLEGAVTAVSEAKELFDTRNAAPLSSLNVVVGPGRRHRVVHLELEPAREVAHRHGGKVNDLVLAVVTGGIRDLLISRGEQVEGLELVAAIPAALRSAQTARDLGNTAGGLSAWLPVGEQDSRKRLERIAGVTRLAKTEQHASRVRGLMDWIGAVGLSQRFVERQRMINFIVTNVPGPPVPLYFAGARIDDVMPLVGTAGNVTLVFAALSYCGRLNVVINADAKACPDIEVLAAGMNRAWEDLIGASAR
jgi:diacylglycerol O-acyltransferase / wax synthase